MTNFKEWWDNVGDLLATLSFIPEKYNFYVKEIAETAWKVALASAERPSNTQMQIDTKTCSDWEHDKFKTLCFYNYCPKCGQPLSD